MHHWLPKVLADTDMCEVTSEFDLDADGDAGSDPGFQTGFNVDFDSGLDSNLLSDWNSDKGVVGAVSSDADREDGKGRLLGDEEPEVSNRDSCNSAAAAVVVPTVSPPSVVLLVVWQDIEIGLTIEGTGVAIIFCSGAGSITMNACFSQVLLCSNEWVTQFI